MQNRKEYMGQWYQKNKEKQLQKSREYYLTHKEEHKKRTRKYNQENKESINEYKRQYYQDNKERWKTYSKNWAKDNPKRRRELQQKYYRSTKGKETSKNRRREYLREWIQIIESHYKRKISCSKCDYNQNFACIDFHHKNPEEKERYINQILLRKPTPERTEVLKVEIQKCDMLCKNCHYELHHPDLDLTILSPQ